MFSEEHLFSIALRKCSFVGDGNFRRLIQHVGSAKEVWMAPKHQLNKIFGIGSKITAEIGNAEHLKFAEKELQFAERKNICIRLRHLNEFPKLLLECEDPPSILYQKGMFDEKRVPVSIVGTRNITPYGKAFIEELLEELRHHPTVTVSGLALGADAEVHEKSLQNNIPTIGVLAHGFHTFYPSKNKLLSERIIADGGALITEFNSSQKPDRENFIQRNRIIAGLSPATIVVETAFGGGSVSTVTFANGYNRDVYALPGKITDKYSQGCNQLISQHKAFCISTVRNLVENLGFSEKINVNGELFPSSEVRIVLSEFQQNIYETVKAYPLISLDELSEKIEIPTFKMLPVLLELEIQGYLKAFSGRQFQAL